MIQDRYKKENLKMEISQHRSRELELVQNNAKLLDELLGHYTVSSSQAEVDLILELRKYAYYIHRVLSRMLNFGKLTPQVDITLIQPSLSLKILFNNYRKNIFRNWQFPIGITANSNIYFCDNDN